MDRSRYQQLRRLAVGGMGEVFLARQVAHEDVKRLVALKCIRPEFSHDPRFQELFRNELRVAAQLSHPNIVHVYDFGIEDDECFLALEYVAGDTLSQVLRKSREEQLNIPIDSILTILLDAAKGLHYAHELKDEAGTPLEIVHRDIAPQNIMVSHEGVAKILDFGIANARITNQDLDDGSIMGHLNYMAPEQIFDAPVDRRADIYAIGLIMWEMTVGRRLHSFDTPVQAMEAVRVETLPNHPELRRCPPGWEGVIRRAISPEPRARYTTALELQCDIEDVARSAGIGISNLSVVRLLTELFPHSAPMKAAALPKRKLTVLSVDDEEENTSLVRRCLRRNYVVETANGVTQAMEMLAESPYDIIISDERMPDGRGAELLTHVARISPETVRIMITAFPEADLMLEVINHGHIHRFLPKPFKCEDLASSVESAIKDVRGMSHANGHSDFRARRTSDPIEFAEPSDDELTLLERQARVGGRDDVALLAEDDQATRFEWGELQEECISELVPGKSLAVVHVSAKIHGEQISAVIDRLRNIGVIVSWQHRVADRVAFIVSGGSRALEFVEVSLHHALATELPARSSYGLAIARVKDPGRFVECADGADRLAHARLLEALPDV
jgi:serine/threonine protein kinase